MSDRDLSGEQYELLLSQMEEHDFFARKQIGRLGSCGVDTYRKMWHSLTQRLNDMGPVRKNWVEWENFWLSLKQTSKTAMSDYLYSSRQTGSHNVQPPNEIVQRVCFIFGFYGMGCSVIPEHGVYKVDWTVDDKSEKFADLYEMKYKNEPNNNNDVKCNGNLCSEYSNLKHKISSTTSSKLTFNPVVKLNAQQLRYVASYIEIKGSHGKLSQEDWNNVAKNSKMPVNVSGTVLQVYWQQKLEKLKGKTRPTPLETEILQAVVGGSIQVKDEDMGTLNSIVLSSDDDAKDIDERYPPFDASCIIHESSDSLGPTQGKQALKEKVAVSGRQDRIPSRAATVKTEAQIHSVPRIPYQPVAKTSNVDTKPLKNRTPSTSSATFKHVHQGTSNEVKKRKVTNLQAQAQGIEIMGQSNDMFQNWMGKMVVAVDANTQELKTANTNLHALASHACESKSTLKELSEQITQFFVYNQMPHSLELDQNCHSDEFPYEDAQVNSYEQKQEVNYDEIERVTQQESELDAENNYENGSQRFDEEGYEGSGEEEKPEPSCESE